MADSSVYDVVGAFQNIEEELIDSMQRNMKRHIAEQNVEEIDWNQWQAEMLNGLAQYKEENAEKLKGYYSTINDDIEETIRKAHDLGASEEEIATLEAIKNGYKVDKAGKGTNAMQGSFFKVDKRKMNALIASTTEDFKTAESSILRVAEDAYRSTIFNAQTYFNSGATTIFKAVDMATKNFLSAGINNIEYKNGARVNTASYSEMALRTANKRASLIGAASKREEYGIHTVKVTSHGSACPVCAIWQGRVYIDDVYGSGTAKEAKSLGYPLLSTAVEGGMFHPNCKNGCSTYYEGINQKPKKPTAEQKDEMNRRYNLEQKQRYMERQIRKNKRLAAGSLDDENIAKYNGRAKQWSKQYEQFVKDNDDVLRTAPERLRLFGINTVQNGGKSATMKPKTRVQNKSTSKVPESAEKCKDYGQLKSYLTSKGYEIDDDIEKLDFAPVKKSITGVERIIKEFPKSADAFKGFGVKPNGVMCASFDGKINFNPSYYIDESKLSGMIQGETTGFHPKNTGILETGSHEMGHILELAVIQNKEDNRIMQITAWNHRTEAKRIVSQSCKMAKKTAEGKGLRNFELTGQISGYAQKNHSECIAEAVADYTANGDNASVLSKMIWQLLKEELS